MGQAPTGTVTFLFTDIEGSTRLWEHEPDAMRESLVRHDAIMRAAIERHGGYVFATGGDGFAVAFARAADAVQAAVEAQRELCEERWPDDAPLRVRMAAHSGEVVEREGDYFGPAVNRAARLMSLAAGGQMVCSHIVGELCGSLADIDFVDVGTHELRGVAEPMRVCVIASRGLPDIPIPVPARVGGNLARPATEFVGRVSELERLATTLLQSRLLTLTGTGGVGKTRLATELAWRTIDEFPDGVWLVELAAVTEPEAVAPAIATALAVRPRPGITLEDAIVDRVAARTCLVVLDNCEHVVDAVEKIVTRILRECPAVTLLATSREPIDVSEEHVWRVRSLDAVEATELFATRAHYADAAAPVSDNERATVTAICERLDGIPLAIELAAARLRSMTTDELLARLDDRFRLLRGSKRSGVERHQTLRAAVTWSYQLLNDDEQQLFDQCAVFAGSFDLDAVEAICSSIDPIDELASLVDKSMIVAERTELGTRYHLLETMRQYGEERLDERGLGHELRDRHLAYYAVRMTETNEMYYGPLEADAVVIYVHDWDNVRAAVAWGDATDEFDKRSALLVATTNFAVNTIRRDHSAWMTSMIEATDAPLLAARSGAAAISYFLGDPGKALDLAYDALRRADNKPDPETFYAWFGGHFAAFAIGDIDEAARLADGATASTGSSVGHQIRALACQAQIAIVRDNDALDGIVADMKVCADQMQNATGRSFYLGDLGIRLLQQGNRAAAFEALEEAVEWARKSGSVTLYNGWQTALAFSLVDAPYDEHARSTFRHMIEQCRAADDWANMWIVIEGLAVHFANNERFEPAALLLAASAQAGRASLDFQAGRLAAEGRLHDEPQAGDWQARGTAMSRDEVVDYALDVLASSD